MIRFEHGWILWLLIAVPLWGGLLWFMLRRRQEASATFVGKSVLQRIAYAMSWQKLATKSALWLLVWSLLVVGFANPQVGTKTEEVKRAGIDIVIALDVSRSMLSEDIRPSRLESARHEILKFVSGLKGDRVGLVAFAGTAINYCPLTTDYGAVKMLVNVMQPEILPDQGTALADAIHVADKSFTDKEAKSRVLVIVTDGEDHEAEAVDAAQEAAKNGIKIYTIGLGTPEGAPIPEKDAQGNTTGFKRDKSGQIVMTHLNDVLLQRIADGGGGKYLRGTQSAGELQAIWDDINSMEKQIYGTKQFTAFEDRFEYLVVPALILLVLEFFISERRGVAPVRIIRVFLASRRKEGKSV